MDDWSHFRDLTINDATGAQQGCVRQETKSALEGQTRDLKSLINANEIENTHTPNSEQQTLQSISKIAGRLVKERPEATQIIN